MSRADELKSARENLYQAQTALRAAGYELGPRESNPHGDAMPSVSGYGDRLFASGIALERLTSGHDADSDEWKQMRSSVKDRVAAMRQTMNLTVGDVREADGTGLEGVSGHLGTARAHLKVAHKALGKLVESGTGSKAERDQLAALHTRVGAERKSVGEGSKAVEVLSTHLQMARTDFRVRTQFHDQPTRDGFPTPQQLADNGRTVQNLGDIVANAAGRLNTHTQAVGGRVGGLADEVSRMADRTKAFDQTGQQPLSKLNGQASATGPAAPRVDRTKGAGVSLD